MMKLLFVLAAVVVTANTRAVQSSGLLKPVDILFDGKELKLDVNLGRPINEQIVRFCRTHGLLPEHCSTLLDHVAALLSSQEASVGEQASVGDQGSAPSTPTNGISGADARQEEAPAKPRELQVPTPADPPQGGKVNYSRRVGPKLEVTMQDGKSFDALQTYVGESAQQACDRFCTKHRLLEPECAQLAQRFLPMHGLETPNPQVGTPAQAAPEAGPGSGLSQRKPAKSAEDWRKDGALPFGYSAQSLLNGAATLVVLAAFRVQWGEDAVAARAAARGDDRRGGRVRDAAPNAG